jgi:hypothetical protein
MHDLVLALFSLCVYSIRTADRTHFHVVSTTCKLTIHRFLQYMDKFFGINFLCLMSYVLCRISAYMQHNESEHSETRFSRESR